MHRQMVVAFAVCWITAFSGPMLGDVGLTADGSQSQKPVKEMEFHIDGGPEPPASLDELWSSGNVVVEGIIQAAEPIDSSFTEYLVQVVEVFKADLQVRPTASAIAVTRMGGVRDKGTHIERRVERGFPLFEVGERYILFLNATQNGRYTLSAEGAFLVSRTTVQPRGRGDVTRPYDNNPELFRLFLRGKSGAR